MRRKGSCGPLLLALLFAVLACLVFASLATVLVLRGEMPLYAPRLTGFEPHPGVSIQPTTPIILTFDQPMDPASVQAAFFLQPAVEGAFDWSPDHTQVTFVPAGAGYELGTSYVARLAAGAEAAVFSRRTGKAVEWRFSLPALMRSSTPGLGSTDLGASLCLEAESSYPLDCGRTLQTFVIDPSLPGQLGCEGQTVAFSPTVPLEPGRAYAASLAHIFLEADPNPRPGVQWQFQTAMPLTVEEVHPVPQALIEDYWSPVRIVFNRPVVPGSLVRRFALLAEDGEKVSGQVQWEAGGAAFVFQPEAPLRPETRYHVQLESGVRDELGFALAEALDVEFTTLGLLGLPEPIPGTQGVALDSILRIPFTHPMDKASVEAGLAFTPTLEGAVAWEGDTLIFVPRDGLSAETAYLVGLSPSVRDATGVPLSKRRQWPFGTEPFLLEARVPSGPEVRRLQQPMSLSFALPMDKDSVEAALSISPSTSGELLWSQDRRQVVFHPLPSWLSGAAYEITLAAAARTANGLQSLGRDVGWEFATAAAEVGFGDGPNLQVVDAAGPRAFQIALRGADVVDFSLHAITPTQLLGLYRAGSGGTGQMEAAIRATGALTPTAQWREVVAPLDEGTSLESWSPVEAHLPADVPLGFYLLSSGSGPLSAAAEEGGQLLVVLTRHALVLKRAQIDSGSQSEAQVLVWDTELGTAAPVVSATVQLYDREGNVLAQGRTDDGGLMALEVPAYPGPSLALAEVGGDVTVCGLGDEWGEAAWSVGPDAAPVPAKAYLSYLYTDRHTYTPGQQIRFGGWIRADDDATYTLPPSNMPVTVRLCDVRDNVAMTQVLTPTAFGTISGAFQLADTMMLGTWHLETDIAGTVTRQPVQVESIPHAQFEVSVRTLQADYVPGEMISITLESQYGFGQPVASARVVLQVYPTREQGSSAEKALWVEPPLLSVEGWTDTQGRWSVALPTDRLLNDTGRSEPLRLALEATVDDDSGQAVSSYQRVVVHPASRELGLFIARRGYGPGEEVSFAARLQDLAGQPVPGAELTARVLGWDGTEVAVGTTATDDAGRGYFVVRLDQQGPYRVIAAGTDEAGRQMTAEEMLWVYDPDREAPTYGGRWGTEEALSIGLDRVSYSAGDEAGLLVQAEAAGPALLSLERGETRLTRLLTLVSGSNLITLEVRPDFAPNVHVTVSQFGPLDPEVWGHERSMPEAELRTASTQLLVPLTSRRLTVTLEASREVYAPGDEAVFHLQVVDAEGQPVTAEVSLSVVEEAAYSLAEEMWDDPFAVFYAPRPNQVRTLQSLGPTRWLLSPPGTVEARSKHTEQLHGDVLDTAYWAPTLVTDEKGKAVARLQLPDNLTEWRVLARAVTTDTLVGQATARLATRQDLVLQPLLPSFVVAGDALTLTARVHNALSEPISATVSLSLEGLALASEEPDEVRLVHIPANGSVLADWPVLAQWPTGPMAQEASQARVSLSAVATQRGTRVAGRDAVEVKLPRIVPTLSEVTTFAGELTSTRASEAFTITLPSDALPGLSRLEIDLASSLVPGLRQAAKSVANYPHGCVEQTMSQVLANAVVSCALRELGLPTGLGEADSPAMIALGLQKLYGYQHDDGGWGWCYDDETNLDQTAYVVLGLALTGQAGFAVDNGVLQHGGELLRRELASADVATQAFGGYVLSTGGLALTTTLNLTTALALDPLSQAAHVLAVDAAGDGEAVVILLDELGKSAVHDGATTHWRGPEGDGGRSMGSDLRATAMVVTALARLAPEFAAVIPPASGEGTPQERTLLPRAVRWLVEQRQGPDWGDPQRSSYALLALSDYLLVSRPPGAGASYRVYVGDRLWKEGELPAADVGHSLVLTYSQALSPTLLVQGDNPVRLFLGAGEGAASARLYYASHWQVQRAFPEDGIAALASHDRSIDLTREYRLAGSSEAVTGLHRGDLVEVSLTLDVPSESWYVIVEDPLPAGLEALNERLVDASYQAPGDGRPVSSWQELGYNRKEVHDDRVTFSITHLEPGRHTLHYLARAVTAGDFAWLPAQGYLMYEPEVWSRSASGRCQIWPR